MPTASCVLPYAFSASTITESFTPKRFTLNTPTARNHKFYACKASASTSASSSLSSSLDFDLYDLLGIDSTSNQSQIKTAYRSLQKKCHPDIAGPAGHDMAIVLNEAYSVLSNPNSRLAYDKEQAKIAELRGFTGKPLYSVWFGSENEQRAVFVDEVKCIGCLKCALLAQNTFAIESVYGRARVVAQWGDQEHKIQEAIESCPVDCISIVERSDLAALEYLMSKQPRGNVRVGASNTAGTRVSNIFIDVKKFQTKFAEATKNAANENSKESDAHWKARMSAVQAIRSFSNWFYQKSPTIEHQQNLIRITQKSTDPDVKRLRDAAAARKQIRDRTRTTHRMSSTHDEYWTPSTQALPASTQINTNSRAASELQHDKEQKKTKNDDYKEYKEREDNRRNPIARGIPVVTAGIAAAIVQLQLSHQAVANGLKDHIGGPLALEIVNSSWLQITLAGITWYFIGVTIVDLIETIGNRQD